MGNFDLDHAKFGTEALVTVPCLSLISHNWVFVTNNAILDIPGFVLRILRRDHERSEETHGKLDPMTYTKNEVCMYYCYNYHGLAEITGAPKSTISRILRQESQQREELVLQEVQAGTFKRTLEGKDPDVEEAKH
ncbi:hypothetical protein RF11_03510 [Thelohanellus kitauei]|uniref:Uncharacterized protein n=1 Tax=Thelohanellus kitauei TaxID=669202 RepID=A0A0C2JVT9_THEKT|nr:hypothetical protein RF11_03510 [Thelohanellus kitauei]